MVKTLSMNINECRQKLKAIDFNQSDKAIIDEMFKIVNTFDEENGTELVFYIGDYYTADEVEILLKNEINEEGLSGLAEYIRYCDLDAENGVFLETGYLQNVTKGSLLNTRHELLEELDRIERG